MLIAQAHTPPRLLSFYSQRKQLKHTNHCLEHDVKTLTAAKEKRASGVPDTVTKRELQALEEKHMVRGRDGYGWVGGERS